MRWLSCEHFEPPDERVLGWHDERPVLARYLRARSESQGVALPNQMGCAIWSISINGMTFEGNFYVSHFVRIVDPHEQAPEDMGQTARLLGELAGEVSDVSALARRIASRLRGVAMGAGWGPRNE